MPGAKPGDVWSVDLGMAAKVRPCLVVTPPPKNDELDVFTGIPNPRDKIPGTDKLLEKELVCE